MITGHPAAGCDCGLRELSVVTVRVGEAVGLRQVYLAVSSSSQLNGTYSSKSHYAPPTPNLLGLGTSRGWFKTKGKQFLLVFRVSSPAVGAVEGAPDRGLKQGLGLAAGSGEMLTGWAWDAAGSSPLAVQTCGREQGET